MKRAFVFTFLAVCLVVSSVIAAKTINTKDVDVEKVIDDYVKYSVDLDDEFEFIAGDVISIEAVDKEASVVNVAINKVNHKDDLQEYVFSVDGDTVVFNENLEKISLFNKLNIGDRLGFFTFKDKEKEDKYLLKREQQLNDDNAQEGDIAYEDNVEELEDVKEQVEDKNAKKVSLKYDGQKVKYSLGVLYGDLEKDFSLGCYKIKSLKEKSKDKSINVKIEKDNLTINVDAVNCNLDSLKGNYKNKLFFVLYSDEKLNDLNAARASKMIIID